MNQTLPIEKEITNRYANTPVHTYIEKIMPYLEYRQAVSKKILNQSWKSEAAINDLKNGITQCNEKIINILDFAP